MTARSPARERGRQLEDPRLSVRFHERRRGLAVAAFAGLRVGSPGARRSLPNRALGAPAIDQRARQRNLLGRVDQALLDHVLPQNCNYIIAGVAVK